TLEPPPPVDSVTQFIAAASDPTDDAVRALAAVLRADATVITPFGRATGPAAVGELLGVPRLRGTLGAATWGPPRRDGATTTVEAVLPPGAPAAAIRSTITVDADEMITGVVQEVVAAPPPEPTALVLPAEVRDDVNGALVNGTPVVVAYVDAGGAPHLSLRGSTQANGDDRLALWIRDPGGGLLRAIAERPILALFYRDGGRGRTYQFTGRARVAEDAATRDAVYAGQPEAERNLDPYQRGVAVIVDLDSVEGIGAAGRFRLER
ncbi:MAG TPA: pyridoxamine 5'-phosphate oxidase family protein, partial [Acidimicrobiia bacterium]|nr:pyridoxamine 5'-phosphate oxidase family protein [Acidimicrobiia bacterium]